MPGSSEWSDLNASTYPASTTVLNRAPFDAAAAQPHERPQAYGQPLHIEHGAGRQRIEVPRQDVETVLMRRYRLQQRTELEHPPAFGPRGVDGAQVHAEQPDRRRRRLDLEERVS